MRIRRAVMTLCLIITAALVTKPHSAKALDNASSASASATSDVARKIEQHKTALEQVKQHEAEVIAALDMIERQLLRSTDDIASLTAQIDTQQQTLRRIQAQTEMLSRRHAVLQRQLTERLCAMYKWYRHGVLPMYLAAPSYTALVRYSKYLDDILKSDISLFARTRQLLEERARRIQELEAQQQALSTAKEELTRMRSQMLQTRQEKTRILASIQKEKTLQTQMLEELERSARELQNLVDRLPQRPESPMPQTMSFAMLKGKLPPPVKGTLISSFGKREHPDLHIATFQKGIEISCPYGTEIRAVHDGTVVFADWVKGYGFMLIVDHGDGYYSLCGRASKLLKKVGDSIRAGETVALVGDSYSMRGACLYFEIRHHGKPQDPLEWIMHDFT
ncbi:MAG: peptidoglycan DD-metalloendopeptidase family protein [Desulfobacterota bacterium]|nr:peptidoglycan DD-metalloendopeptidase family protein [Thermodesulfobacteriota bacterium]